MTTRYVGIGGNDGNSGLTWALRKLTLNGVEDTPVVAGDTVYVGPGTYREELTCDVSGGAGTPITYIGDYSGDNTDGVGGVVRITGSDDDITTTRNYCIHISVKNYRTFQGIKVDLSVSYSVYSVGAVSNLIIDECYFGATDVQGFFGSGNLTDSTIKNCIFKKGYSGGLPAIAFWHWATVDDTGNAIDNCIMANNYSGIYSQRIGGITIRNSTITGSVYAIRVEQALGAGQSVTVNNCIIYGNQHAFNAVNLGEIVEDYNSVSNNITDRTNVAVGGNSNTYPPLFDSRWFFETVR